MKVLVVLLLAISPALAVAEDAWKCPDGSVAVGKVKPCLGGLYKNVDDMNAAELNAYVKAQRGAEIKVEQQKKIDEMRRAAEETRRRVAEDLDVAPLRQFCGRFYGADPTIGMTEEQFEKCSWKGKPTTKNHTQTGTGTVVQYVYKVGNAYSFYYFRNGVLTSMQY